MLYLSPVNVYMYDNSEHESFPDPLHSVTRRPMKTVTYLASSIPIEAGQLYTVDSHNGIVLFSH